MALERKFKGYTEEELKNMPLEKFAKIVNARARRSILRLRPESAFFKLINKVRKLKAEKKLDKPIKTHAREAVCIPEWLGLKFLVYNGKEWKEVQVTLEKLGRRLGEYSFTTKEVKHSGPGVGATRGSKFIPLK
ncbi:MAG: 30S ribosomal protein S19 [Candidatus Anstonellales archaeon]